MSGQGIEVDHVSVRKAASNVEKAKHEVVGLLGALGHEAERMREGWRGAAGNAFQALMIRWRKDADNLMAAMEDISQTLTKSASAHEQADSDALHHVNRITSTLNP